MMMSGEKHAPENGHAQGARILREPFPENKPLPPALTLRAAACSNPVIPSSHPGVLLMLCALRRYTGLLIFAGLAGCQGMPASVQEQAPAPAPEAREPALVVSTWRADVLADLMVAEIAGQRGQLQVALEAYLRQAQALRDPQLAARATRIAWFARDRQRVREAATLWVELAPEEPEANANAIVALIQAGDIEGAFPLLDRLLDRRTAPLRFNYIVQYALEADATTRARVDQALAELSVRHPKVARLWLARAVLAEADGESARALDFVRQARRLEPDHAPAVTVEGRLLATLGHPDAARRVLARGSRQFPLDRELRLTHLQVLLEQGRGRDARTALEDMMKRWPEDGDLAFSLAIVEWESGDPLAAENRLLALAESGHREDEAWFNAGRIALSRRDYETAAGYFQNVGGPQYLAAQIQVALAWQRAGRMEDALSLLTQLRIREPAASGQIRLAESELRTRTGQADEALAVLDRAVTEMPDNDDLLYARALAAERTGRIDITEADLRVLLERQPENPMVLNALGYTLADRTERAAEAIGYIERALAISPDDPAILDSMGWVLFKLGRPEEAIIWLRRAHTLSRDGEIAAHLGEALWQTGKRGEARRIWKRALAIDPDNRALRRTMERLDP